MDVVRVARVVDMVVARVVSYFCCLCEDLCVVWG